LLLIGNENLDLVGSSNANFRFVSDLIFFKLVALTERAFDEYEFNSEQQQKSILDVLRHASRFMEGASDRRNEVRALAMSLQGRVIQRYLDGANLAYKQYMSVVLTKEEKAALPGLGLPPEEVSATVVFVYDQLDTILNCVQFIVSMYQLVKSQPFRPERAMDMIDQVKIASYVAPCVRRMLSLLDFEEFVAAEEAANTLLFLTEHFKQGIDTVNSFDFLVPPDTKMNCKMVTGIAKHIKHLCPAYQFAQDKLTWRRSGGVFAQPAEFSAQYKTRFQRCTCDIGSVLIFTDKVITALEKIQDIVHDLVLCSITRLFVLSTLIDPVELLRFSVTALWSDSKSLVGSIGLAFMRGFDKSDCHELLWH
jgi:hypothetical protein